MKNQYDGLLSTSHYQACFISKFLEMNNHNPVAHTFGYISHNHGNVKEGKKAEGKWWV